MNMKELKEKMERDMKRLSSLDINIMEGKVLYREALKHAFTAYLFFMSTVCLIFIPMFYAYGWDFLINFFKYLSMFAVFFLVMIAVGFNSIITYVILTRTVFPLLETGEFLRKKMLWSRNVGAVSIVVLLLSLTLFLLNGHWSDNEFDGLVWTTYLLLIMTPAFVLMNIATNIEFNRLGISAFMALVRSLVKKEDPNAPPSSTNPKSGVPPEVDMGNAANPLSELNPHYHHWNPWDRK